MEIAEEKKHSFRNWIISTWATVSLLPKATNVLSMHVGTHLSVEFMKGRQALNVVALEKPLPSQQCERGPHAF